MALSSRFFSNKADFQKSGKIKRLKSSKTWEKLVCILVLKNVYISTLY